MTIDLTKPLRTRDGRPVRIICTDRKGGAKPIIGLTRANSSPPGDESVFSWNEDGSFSKGEQDPLDLVNVPQKLEGWINIYRSTKTVNRWGGRLHHTKEAAEDDIGDEDAYLGTFRIEWEE